MNTYTFFGIIYLVALLLGFYIPFLAGPEALKILKSPAATMSTAQRLFRLMDQIGHTMFFDSEYTHYKTSSKGHKKGDSKLWDAIKDLTPLIQGLERAKHPEEAVKYFDKLF